MLEGFKNAPIDPGQNERRERQRMYAKVHAALEQNTALSGILGYGVDEVVGLEQDLAKKNSSLTSLSGRQGNAAEFYPLLGLVEEYFDARNGYREKTLELLAKEIDSLSA